MPGTQRTSCCTHPIAMYDPVANRPKGRFVACKYVVHALRILLNQVVRLWIKCYSAKDVNNKLPLMSIENFRYLTSDQLSQVKTLKVESNEQMTSTGRALLNMYENCSNTDLRDKFLRHLSTPQKEFLYDNSNGTNRAKLAQEDLCYGLLNEVSLSREMPNEACLAKVFAVWGEGCESNREARVKEVEEYFASWSFEDIEDIYHKCYRWIKNSEASRPEVTLGRQILFEALVLDAKSKLLKEPTIPSQKRFVHMAFHELFGEVLKILKPEEFKNFYWTKNSCIKLPAALRKDVFTTMSGKNLIDICEDLYMFESSYDFRELDIALDAFSEVLIRRYKPNESLYKVILMVSKSSNHPWGLHTTPELAAVLKKLRGW
ncbi:MAG: hypothetical protein H0X51_01820 [Parachlamydiaceae bacterium]|nr:hypothetical protein [Tatlockia sp.]MBA3957121.1 hypothetical protein [Parachlamydiaceae bacterium]